MIFGLPSSRGELDQISPPAQIFFLKKTHQIPAYIREKKNWTMSHLVTVKVKTLH